jgi:hypothetical protein
LYPVLDTARIQLPGRGAVPYAAGVEQKEIVEVADAPIRASVRTKTN